LHIKIVNINNKEQNEIKTMKLNLINISFSEITDILNSLINKTQSERKNFVSIYPKKIEAELKIIYQTNISLYPKLSSGSALILILIYPSLT
jgi:hypothetical protein